MPKQAKKEIAPKKDALDLLAEGPAVDVLALVLWKLRMVNPELTVHIDENDMRALAECAAYLKIKPEARIVRPQGRPATPAIVIKNKTIPAREAEPPKPYVMVHLVNKGSADTIRAIENNQDTYDKQQAIMKARAAKDKLPQIINMVRGQIMSGDFSTSLVNDLCDEATALVVA